MTPIIDTDDFSTKLRAKAVRPATRELLVTRLAGSDQVQDLTEKPLCDGFGRIRHFKRVSSTDWVLNPLPIDPAAHRLGLPVTDGVNALVFQNAACNWRCWYCFVPFKLLNADERYAAWFTADQLVDLYLAAGRPTPMIDLSGGQPELTPEWVPWMMEALERRGLADKVFLWSDDNLSTDYFWRYLPAKEIERVRAYRMYSKVCCFKGFDSESFAFNTRAAPELFDRQFELFARYLALGIDLYAYATFTAPRALGIERKMGIFVDRLQRIHPALPLRTVPLEIIGYGVVEDRDFKQQAEAMDAQRAAIEAWKRELERRFPSELRGRSIVEIDLRHAA